MAQWVKNSPAMQEMLCNAGYAALKLGLGRSLGERYGNPLQLSCLRNTMDKEAWQAWGFMGLQEVDTI